MSIGDRIPPVAFRVDLSTGRADGHIRFESKASAMKEDELRARLLRRAAKRHPTMIDATKADHLASKLELGGARKRNAITLASSAHMRTLRINAGGALWGLVASDMSRAPRTGTVLGQTWEITPDALVATRPADLLKRFRTDLYDKGAATADGWLVASIHGEFDPGAGKFRLHAHLIADGDMVGVVDRLREKPNYKTGWVLPDGSPSAVYRRVRLGRKDLTDLPDPLTYLWQSFWPQRSTFVAEDGRRRRQRQKARIDDPWHALYLLWLDRWSLSDMTLLIGLRHTANGLVTTTR